MAIGFILGFVFIVLAFGAGAWAFIEFDNCNSVRGTISVIGCIALIICFILVPFSFHTVDTGEVAVVKSFGKIKEVKTAGISYDFLDYK